MNSTAPSALAATRSVLAMAIVLLLVGCLAAPVIAQTVPGPPTGVTATPGNGLIMFNWSAPASDGGSAITSYSITCVSALNPRDSHSDGAGGVRYSSAMTHLTNGTLYNCGVSAYNAIGKGPESAASALPVVAWVHLATPDDIHERHHRLPQQLRRHRVRSSLGVDRNKLGPRWCLGVPCRAGAGRVWQ